MPSANVGSPTDNILAVLDNRTLRFQFEGNATLAGFPLSTVHQTCQGDVRTVHPARRLG